MILGNSHIDAPRPNDRNEGGAIVREVRFRRFLDAKGDTGQFFA